jgi:DNA invertase Pin-like site-specific DNA recombinase
MTKQSTKPAVGYVRMSTDKQEDSPARQRGDIEAIAERLGYRITTWYEDHGLTGTESANRPEFRRLLGNAKGGKFQAVLLSEQSRMSREDVFDAMVHWKLLRDAGVKIVTCQRGELDFSNLGGVITAIVDQYGAREESVKLAQRVASGQRLKAKQGQRIGGIVFGYDREVYDDTGKPVKRVHFRERFRKPPSWRTKMVPSEDEAAVEGVQWAFDAVRRGQSIGHVMRGLNERGLKTTYGKPFTISTVGSMLKNPAYAGVLRVGTYSRGKFSSVAEDGLIIVENAHEALVTPDVFERVQKVFAERKERTPHSRPDRYILSRIVTCQHCGIRMYGVRRSKQRKHIAFYQCNPSPGVVPYSPKCPHPAVRAERLETFVLDMIRERLLEAGAEERIREAILKAKRRDATRVSREERQLCDLSRKIERATENLALAVTDDDFAAISKLLVRWRDEESALAERMEQRGRDLEPLPEALRVLARLSEIPGNLAKADRAKLAHALRQTVSSVTVGVRDARSYQITYRELRGELSFHEAFGLRPIAIPDEVIGQRRIWREIGELARRAKKPVRLADVCRLIDSADPSHASYHLQQAVRAGLVRKLEGNRGWVPAGLVAKKGASVI